MGKFVFKIPSYCSEISQVCVKLSSLQEAVSLMSQQFDRSYMSSEECLFVCAFDRIFCNLPSLKSER